MQRRRFLQTSALLTGLSALWKPEMVSGRESFDSLMHSTTIPDETFWKFVRQQFLLPEDYAYFNTGGLGSSPTIVLETVYNEMREREITPSPAINMEKWLNTKRKVAEFIGAEMDEIAFTNSATEGNNIVLNGLPLKTGDEIITSTHEHAGLEVPLLNLMTRTGIVIKTFQPDFQNGLGNLDRIDKLITKKTRLIFVSHFTCTTGQRFPAKEICELGHQKNLWVAFDGAQTAGNMPIHIKEIDCDFYAACCHKWMLGPKRTGFLYIRKTLLDTLKAINVGAYSTSDSNLLNNLYIPFPSAQRFEFATQNDALYAGVGTAIDFINKIGISRIWNHNKGLAEFFVAELLKIPEIQILSPEEAPFRTSLITFKVKNKNFRDIATALTNERYRVRIVPEGNVDGIRVSMHLYNNQTEVEKLIDKIKTLIK
ncbi:aminotransferase class V-fold PLP-dependent enzyme [candidate division KSB1 bacterium]|nr:aminotransferase class V-fold PLP-dependent enzyme [candidate division KSB1 bacterium]